jgi:hypothetical protein
MTSLIEIVNSLYHRGWGEVMRVAAACSQPSSWGGVTDDGSVAAAASSAPITFDVSRFKVLLEKMLVDNDVDSSQDDRWMSLQVPPNIIVGSEHASGGAELWSILRNALAQMWLSRS